MPARRRVILGAAAGTVGAGIALRGRQGWGATTISVADYGAVPGVGDAGPGVLAAIAALPKTGGATLMFPKGVYQFSPRTEVAMRLVGIENLTVEGYGAALKFDGQTFPFMVSGCHGLSIRGLTIDWQRPPFSQGEVVGVAPDKMTIDVRIDPQFPVNGTEPVDAIATHERATGLMTIGGIDAIGKVKQVSLIGPQILRLVLRQPFPFRLGNVVVLRHQVHGVNAIRLTNCGGVAVTDVNIYAAPGMALLIAGCRGITVDRFRVEPTPGSTRLMSTCADGMHFAGCRGTIDIRDCALKGMGDDGINVHGELLTVMDHPDARTLVLDTPGHRTITSHELPPEGEHFGIIDDQSLHSFGEHAIAGAGPGRNEKLTFAKDLPAAIRPGDLLYDADEAPRVTISRCRFLGNRARGILAHRNIVIEKCQFANQSHQAVLIPTNANEPEGPTVRNVTIANNEFRGTGRLGLPHGAICVISRPRREKDQPQPNVEPEPINSDVRIVGNTIIDSGASAIEVGETHDLTIASNRIKRREGPAIVLHNVRAAQVTENTCDPPAPIVIKNTPQEQVTFSKNAGLIFPTGPILR